LTSQVDQTQKKRVLIFIVSYHTEALILDVISRIPDRVWNNETFGVECLIVDAQAADETFLKVSEFVKQWPDRKITVLRNPQNQGYGGIQKIGYYYAIKNRFDAVVLLQGDGQYPPEMIEEMVLPILNEEAEAVCGSRMIPRKHALLGGMPLYKWIASQFLTALQNWILGANLSEFHTRFRAYRVSALASLPFKHNSDYYDFDTDILIQLLDTRKRIAEISIPTHHEAGISRVNGFRYGLLILTTSFVSRLVPRGIFYHPKFDYVSDNSVYTPKLGFESSHQYAIDYVRANSSVLDLGCGPGLMARELAKKQVRTISVDRFLQPEMEEYSYKAIQSDVEKFDFEAQAPSVDYVLLLDIIEHLKSPEALLERLRDRYGAERPEVIITTANIAFIIIRLSLLLGQFNYGKRGILDLDHARLFTFGSLRTTLTTIGYEIVEEKGIPAPFPLALGDNFLGHFVLRLNALFIRISRGLFAYQIAVIARPEPTLKHLLRDAEQSSRDLLNPVETL
jgi:SAM-dependent methyltransferase